MKETIDCGNEVVMEREVESRFTGADAYTIADTSGTKRTAATWEKARDAALSLGADEMDSDNEDDYIWEQVL